jgi:hypothetical protein
MDSRLKGFILFCIERRGGQWPGLYDEMAKVASSRLYQGLGYADLRRLGLSLSLDGIEKTRSMVNEVMDGSEVIAKADELGSMPAEKITAKLAPGY